MSIEGFIEHKQYNNNIAKSTADKYALYLRRLYEFLPNAQAATREELEKFVGIESHQQGLSPTSRRALVACIRGYYRFLHVYRLIPDNPAATLPYPRIGKRLPRGASLATAERLLMATDLSTFKGLRDAAIIAVLVGCGLRVSGLCNLNTSALLWHPQGLVLRVKEKGQHERLIPAPLETECLIKAYTAHRQFKKLDRTLPDGDEVLFVSVKNTRISADSHYGQMLRLTTQGVWKMLREYGKRLDLTDEQINPHAFRHLFGTEMTEDDVNTIVIQRLMGHRDPKSTEIYVDVAMRKLGDTIRKSSPITKINTPVSNIVRQIRR